jgi:hypothetical protein
MWDLPGSLRPRVVLFLTGVVQLEIWMRPWARTFCEHFTAGTILRYPSNLLYGHTDFYCLFRL